MTDDEGTLFEGSRLHQEALHENTRSDIRQLVEVVLTLGEKIDRNFTASRTGFSEVNARIDASVSQLVTRIETLEQRVERLESIVLKDDA